MLFYVLKRAKLKSLARLEVFFQFLIYNLISKLTCLLTLSVLRRWFPYQGVWSFMRPLHPARSKASSSGAPTTRMSSSTVLLQDLLERPGGRLPATFKFVTLFRESLPYLLLTCPHNRSRLLLTTYSKMSTAHLSNTSPLLSQSCQGAPALYRSILRSQLVNMARTLSVIGQLSQP